MSTTTSTPANPKLRWFQYRLRTLLVLMALCGMVARWVGDPIIKVRRQAKAANAIRASGGQVYADQETPALPAWVRRFYRPDMEFSVTEVTLSEDDGDPEMAPLADLPDLICLIIDGSRVTDAGLAHLSGLINLTVLNLAETHITDTGLQSLSGLTKLADLDLSETQITDSGLRSLRGLTNLTQLNLSDTHITDAGLEQLKSMPQLRALWLGGTQVTKDGIKRFIVAMPNCSIPDPYPDPVPSRTKDRLP